MDYVFGLYYFQEDGFVHDFVPFGSTLYIYDVANDVDTQAYAAFFHVDYAISDAFGVTVGARYSWDDKKFEGGQADLDGYNYKSSGCHPPTGPDMACWAAFAALPFINLAPFPDPTNPYRYFPPGEQSQEYSVFTPTFGAQWHVNDDQMLYASFSKGFKAGGWTTRLSNPLADINDAAFGPEEAEAYELGYKSQFADHRVQLNVAAFYTDYTGIQLQIQEGASPVSQNAGDAELKGVEIELNAIVGGGFSFYLGGGYIDAEYSRLLTTVTGITLASDLPKTPEYKITLSPQFDVNLANTGKLRFAVDYTHTASMYNDAPNTVLLGRDSTENLGAAIHYFSPEEKYSLTLGGTNLTDDRYLTVGSVNGAQGETVGTYNRPREWYLNLRMTFE
jgi:iron complex outermembrane receptor protein